MARRSVIVVGLLVVFGVVVTVTASPASNGCIGDQIMWAGQQTLAVIDTNGQIGPDADDCTFTGFFESSNGATGQGAGTNGQTHTGTVCTVARQGGGTQLPFCQNTDARGDATVGPQGVNVLGFGYGIFGPRSVDFFGADGSSSPAGGAGGRIGTPPVLITRGRVEESGRTLGSAVLCNDGLDPAVLVTQASGVKVLLRMTSVYASGQDYRCVMVPLPTISSGIQFFDVCFPVQYDGSVDIGTNSDVTVLIPGVLPPCGSRAAPVASEWVLIALAAALLVAGTWLIGRRRRFSESLLVP